MSPAPRRWRRVALALCGAAALFACSGWEPSRPFERESPEVNRANESLDAGDAGEAEERLTAYLGTGPCQDGEIGVSERTLRLENASIDLGLALFALAESFGGRFDESPSGIELPESVVRQRQAQLGCAERILEQITKARDVSPDTRARALYLLGNTLFLGNDYDRAIQAYDGALTILPGSADGGPTLGNDIAWNRAIALERRANPPDGGDNGDAGQDDNDAGDDAGDGGDGDGGEGDGGDGGGGGGDAGPDSSDSSNPPDGGSDPQADPDDSPPDAGGGPPPPQSQDEQILDSFENAPTVQQEAARRDAQRHRVRGMVDK